jgi:hypothetical protein
VTTIGPYPNVHRARSRSTITRPGPLSCTVQSTDTKSRPANTPYARKALRLLGGMSLRASSRTTSGAHSRSVAIDHDLWRSVSVHQDAIVTMDDKGRHLNQSACLDWWWQPASTGCSGTVGPPRLTTPERTGSRMGGCCQRMGRRKERKRTCGLDGVPGIQYFRE